MNYLHPKALEDIVTKLKNGELIGMPTETVYGLAGDASNVTTVDTIFAVKGRPTSHPLIVHIPDASYLDQWATNIPETARKCAQGFWPGPLTLILEKRPDVNSVVTGGKKTIALRVPKHPIAQQILQAFKGGLAAPSANRYCHLSATNAQAVKEELGDQVSTIIASDACDVGIESTIIDFTQTQPTIVRPGKLTAQNISMVIGQPVVYASTDQPHVPGNLTRHYAPETPTFLCSTAQLKHVEPEAAVLSFEPAPTGFQHWHQFEKKPASYAKALYQTLRDIDHEHLVKIYIELPPEDENWRAIIDRLKRLGEHFH